jgi:hypothetical protein
VVEGYAYPRVVKSGEGPGHQQLKNVVVGALQREVLDAGEGTAAAGG